MPKSIVLTINIAAAITILILAGIGILAVCNVIAREQLTEIILRTLAIMAILTGASVAVAYLAGRTRE